MFPAAGVMLEGYMAVKSPEHGGFTPILQMQVSWACSFVSGVVC